jgi:hypothetical protein
VQPLADGADRVTLEGLALMLDASLRVVLCVGAQEAALCLGLTDELGLGLRSRNYDVEVVEHGRRRRRGMRIRGVGNFADLRQLRLGVDGGER